MTQLQLIHRGIMVLTSAEKAEIIQLARTNSYRQTANRFNDLHPNRGAPLHFTTVARLFENIRKRGSIERKKRTISPRVSAENHRLREDIVERFTESPHLSTRRAAAQIGKSHTFIWNVLKEANFTPFKMSKHQKLHPDDLPKRKLFCERLLQLFNENPTLQRNILWTDEKLFPINGCFNKQNLRFVLKKLSDYFGVHIGIVHWDHVPSFQFRNFMKFQTLVD